MRRHMTATDKQTLALFSAGECARCCADLPDGWHADHRTRTPPADSRQPSKVTRSARHAT